MTDFDSAMNDMKKSSWYCNIFADGGGDLNSELSRVVTELESAIHERKKKSEEGGIANDTTLDEGEDDDVEEKALEV